MVDTGVGSLPLLRGSGRTRRGVRVVLRGVVGDADGCEPIDGEPRGKVTAGELGTEEDAEPRERVVLRGNVA